MNQNKECLYDFGFAMYGSEFAYICKKCDKDIFDFYSK